MITRSGGLTHRSSWAYLVVEAVISAGCEVNYANVDFIEVTWGVRRRLRSKIAVWLSQFSVVLRVEINRILLIKNVYFCNKQEIQINTSEKEAGLAMQFNLSEVMVRGARWVGGQLKKSGT